MKPKPQPRDSLELFQAHFDQMLNPSHELILLARKIDWPTLDAAFADCYRPDIGAPAKAVHLMVGLHYLKYAFDESDESVVARWVENPYWQYFCGYTHMQYECPIHPTSMTKWRNRVGAERLQALLTETIALAVREKQLPKNDLAHITVDTTVQQKNITSPTDSKLLYKAICKLGDAAKSRGIALRQSYVRVGKQAAVMAGRYAHAKQFKRMRRRLRKLRTYVGRLIRDIRRKTTDIDEALATLLGGADRIRGPQPKDNNKLYSLHEPEVQCISNGQSPQALRVWSEGWAGHDQSQHNHDPAGPMHNQRPPLSLRSSIRIRGSARWIPADHNRTSRTVPGPLELSEFSFASIVDTRWPVARKCPR